jgi:transcription initiation factor TFIID subunit 12
LHSIAPNETFDAEVIEILLEMADDFIDNCTMFSCDLARHRNSNVLELKDVQMHLEKNWNIRVPGYQGSTAEANSEVLHTKRTALVTDAHKRRLHAISQASITPDEENDEVSQRPTKKFKR